MSFFLAQVRKSAFDITFSCSGQYIRPCKKRRTELLRSHSHHHDPRAMASESAPPTNINIWLDPEKGAQNAARRQYDKSFMQQLLRPFPGGNLASAYLNLSWIRWSGSVLPRVWLTVLLWTVYATLWVAVSEVGGYREKMSAPNAAPVTLLGFAVSLLLGFRTNSAYERWYEGRKLFETACARVRELIRWWTVFYPPTTDDERGRQLAASRCAVAYIYALMYHLRDENPMEHEDCVGLIPRCADGSLAIETNDPTMDRYFFETSSEKPSYSKIRTFSGKRRRHVTAFTLPGTWRNPHVWSVPGQLITLLYSYWDSLNLNKLPPGMLMDLSNVQVSLERILSTPMPPIYSIHLKHVLTLYFLVMPFQFLSWGWGLIPLVAVTSFVMWGFEAMGLGGLGMGMDDFALFLTS